MAVVEHTCSSEVWLSALGPERRDGGGPPAFFVVGGASSFLCRRGGASSFLCRRGRIGCFYSMRHAEVAEPWKTRDDVAFSSSILLLFLVLVHPRTMRKTAPVCLEVDSEMMSHSPLWTVGWKGETHQAGFMY